MQRSTACSAFSWQRPYSMQYFINSCLNSSEVKFSAVPYSDTYRIFAGDTQHYILHHHLFSAYKWNISVKGKKYFSDYKKQH